MKKKLISGLLAATLAFSLAACGGSSSTAAEESASEASSATTQETSADLTGDGFAPDVDYAALAGTTIRVAASPVPHAEILGVAADILAQADITLEIVEFTDYIQPNMVTADGQVDANYFQHGPYLENFNAENGTDLVSVAAIHYEPLGLYPGKAQTLDALTDGAQIGVPNDPTNEARALQLLAAQGLITLREGAGLEATKNDIEENPKNLEIVEMEAAQLPRQLASLDMAVINGNYASEAGFSSASDALAAEDAASEAAQTYANVLVVQAGNEDTPQTKALAAALQSQAVKDFITETYEGAVVAIF
ncbi:MAG TPA: metal ABC transporter substrate-binding protein [Candidatus Gemmiger avicola]|uniref:Metal ABC transporter substrate-binding protein n=1 Tax=Candidatus Gemmiger avicola TaxID=2838605 RepID=A0A9D2S3U8_9FIRM|nr:metal ABC transporter substrate-binding protein [Candidatus Gemmiger avicola]